MKFILVLHITYIVFNLGVGVHSNERTRRFVGGSTAEEGQFPYMVSLRHAHNNGHFCGGSIIHNDTILTAARCLVGTHPEEVFVAVGSTSSFTLREYYRVDKFAIHPYFDAASLINDIALIKLKKSIQFSSYVKRILLDLKEPPIGVNMTISGYGRLFYKGPNTPNSPTLQYGDVTSISLQQCRQQMEEIDRNHFITINHMCTYSGPNFGACLGDIGSPLVHNWTQVGILSWNFCATGYPDVHVKVASYAEWIEIESNKPINEK